MSAEIDGKPAHFEAVQTNEVDQHVAVLVPITADSRLFAYACRTNFGIAYPYAAPAMGAASSNLKFVSEHWNAAHDRLELQVAGAGGGKYRVPLAGDLTGITVSGAELSGNLLLIDFPPGPSDIYTTKAVLLQFSPH